MRKTSLLHKSINTRVQFCAKRSDASHEGWRYMAVEWRYMSVAFGS